MSKKAKKYYWLKLQKDFFKRHDVKIIENMPNGKDYIIFYLKLLTESIAHDGRLRFSDTLPYDENMIATITDTNIDVVRSAIKLFQGLHLMEVWDDLTYYMTETQKMLGYETEWAQQKREYRKNQLSLDTDRTKKDNVRQEKEIELEIDKDKELNNIGQKLTGVDDLFNIFWDNYPRKVGKDRCMRWFKSHKVTEEFVNDLVIAISNQKQSIQWNKKSKEGVKGAFIPHPLTWLNRGGWNDELDYVETPQQTIKNRWGEFLDEK